MKKFRKFILIFFILISGSVADAFWGQKEKFIAKINDEIITIDEFKNKLKTFHTLDMSKKTEVDVSNVDHRQILEDLIDDRLMIQEASSIGLDKIPEFVSAYNLSELNFSLSRLRQEEIMDKIKVSDEEIWQRYSDINEAVRLRHIFTVDKEKAERLLKALKNGKDFAELAKRESETTEAIKEKGGDIGFKKKAELFKEVRDKAFSMEEGEISDLVETKRGFHMFKLEEKKRPEGEIPEKDRKRINRAIFKEKEMVRNAEFIASLQKSAVTTINESAVESIKPDMGTEKNDMTIATVNGEPIKALKLIKMVKSAKLKGDEAELEKFKRNVLDTLIRRKLIDIEAKSRNYEKDLIFQDAQRKIKEALLVKFFKVKILGDAVKLSEDGVRKYYEDNKDDYRDPDDVRFKAIQIKEISKAEKTFAELMNGADFHLMFEETSINSSAPDKGDSGWIPITSLDPAMSQKLDEMEENGIYGPFKIKKSYIIVKFVGRKQYEPKKFEKVRDDIIVTMKKKRYNELRNSYLGKLRSASSIKVNESALKVFTEKIKNQD